MSREQYFKFCPECGGGDFHKEAAGPPRHVCRSCGLVYHLDPKLACAGLLFRDDSVLLVRRARPPQKGFWCLPGGFMDRGETAEEACEREFREETGLKVKTNGLFGLYSYPGYEVVVAIFRVEIIEGELKPNPEVTEFRWFRARDIPWLELAFPSAGDSLTAWVNQLAGSENRSPAD